MDRLKRVEQSKQYYKDNFTPEEQQMHLNFTSDAIKELLKTYENKFVTGDDRHLMNLAMLEDFKEFMERINN